MTERSAEPSSEQPPDRGVRVFTGRSHLFTALLATASGAMLSLSYAPFELFFLAWLAIAVWLYAVSRFPSQRMTFLWSWIYGTVFFGASMFWLFQITLAGAIALAGYLGLYIGLGCMVLRGVGALSRGQSAWRSLGSIFVIAIVWTGVEALRGWVMTGLAWLMVGHSQSPILAMCQIADVTGVSGVTFWVVMINAVIVLSALRCKIIPGAMVTGLVCAAVLAYGMFRISETATTPGPNLLLVQPNYPQDNSGEKGASVQEVMFYHLETTRNALANARRRGEKIDLVLWSETMLPPINVETRLAWQGRPFGIMLQSWYEDVRALVAENGVPLLAGGTYMNQFVTRTEKVDGDTITYPAARERRNSIYYFLPDGTLSPLRYDKVHLVPFGEFIPFKHSIPPLHQLLLSFGPPYYEEYHLVAGDESQPVVFELKLSDDRTVRMVTPICFEDVFGRRVAKMLRGDNDKLADVIINATNDGWFSTTQMPQHFQIAQFRSIENRVPTARAVNTGISGFIDSTGKPVDRLPASIEGSLVGRLALDPRVTFYTKFGDLFAMGCMAGLAVITLLGMFRSRLRSLGRKSLPR